MSRVQASLSLEKKLKALCRDLFFTKYWPVFHEAARMTSTIGAQTFAVAIDQFIEDASVAFKLNSEAVSQYVQDYVGQIFARAYVQEVCPDHPNYVERLTILIMHQEGSKLEEDFLAYYVDYLESAYQSEQRPDGLDLSCLPQLYSDLFLNLKLENGMSPLRLAGRLQKDGLIRAMNRLAEAYDVTLVDSGLELKDYLVGLSTSIPKSVIDLEKSAKLTVNFQHFVAKMQRELGPADKYNDRDVSMTHVEYAYYTAAASSDSSLWSYLRHQSIHARNIRSDSGWPHDAICESGYLSVGTELLEIAHDPDFIMLALMADNLPIIIDIFTVAKPLGVVALFRAIAHWQALIPKELLDKMLPKLEAQISAVVGLGDISPGWSDSEGNTLLHLAVKVSATVAFDAYKKGWGKWGGTNDAGKTPLTIKGSQISAAHKDLHHHASFGGILGSAGQAALLYLEDLDPKALSAEHKEDALKLLRSLFYDSSKKLFVGKAAQFGRSDVFFRSVYFIFERFFEERMIELNDKLLILAVGKEEEPFVENEEEIRLKVVELLVSQGACSDEALRTAMKRKSGRMALCMLEKRNNVRINEPMEFQGQTLTLLHLARMQKAQSKPIIEALLLKGADVSLMMGSSKRLLPFINDVHCSYLNALYKKFIKLINKGDLEPLKKFLHSFGVTWLNLYDPDTHMAPTHTLAKNGHHDVIRQLLKDKGARPIVTGQLTQSDRSADRRTPLHYAVLGKHVDTFNALTGLFNCEASINDVDDDGNTVLHLAIAVSAGQEMMDAVIKSGVNIEIKNRDGQTARQVDPKGFFAKNRLKVAEDKAAREIEKCTALLAETSELLNCTMSKEACASYAERLKDHRAEVDKINYKDQEDQEHIGALLVRCKKLEGESRRDVDEAMQAKFDVVWWLECPDMRLSGDYNFFLRERQRFLWLMSENEGRALDYIKLVGGRRWRTKEQRSIFVEKIKFLMSTIEPEIFKRGMNGDQNLLHSYQMAAIFSSIADALIYHREYHEVKSMIGELSKQGVPLDLNYAGTALSVSVVPHWFTTPEAKFDGLKVEAGFFSEQQRQLWALADTLLDALLHQEPCELSASVAKALMLSDRVRYEKLGAVINLADNRVIADNMERDSAVEMVDEARKLCHQHLIEDVDGVFKQRMTRYFGRYVDCINDSLSRQEADETPLKWGDSEIAFDSLFGWALARRLRKLRECYRYGNIAKSAALLLVPELMGREDKLFSHALSEIQADLSKATNGRCNYFKPGLSWEIQVQLYTLSYSELCKLSDSIRKAHKKVVAVAKKAISSSCYSPERLIREKQRISGSIGDYIQLYRNGTVRSPRRWHSIQQSRKKLFSEFDESFWQKSDDMVEFVAESVVVSPEEAGKLFLAEASCLKAFIVKATDWLFADVHDCYLQNVQGELSPLEGQFDSAEKKYESLSLHVQQETGTIGVFRATPLLEQYTLLKTNLLALTASVAELKTIVDSRQATSLPEGEQAEADPADRLYRQCMVVEKQRVGLRKKDITAFSEAVNKAYKARDKEVGRQQKLEEEAAEITRCRDVQIRAKEVNGLLERLRVYLDKRNCTVELGLCDDLNTLSGLIGKGVFASSNTVSRLILLEPQRLARCSDEDHKVIIGLIEAAVTSCTEALRSFKVCSGVREEIKRLLYLRPHDDHLPGIVGKILEVSKGSPPPLRVAFLSENYNKLVERHCKLFEAHASCTIASPSLEAELKRTHREEKEKFSALIVENYRAFIKIHLDVLNDKLQKILEINPGFLNQECIDYCEQLRKVVSCQESGLKSISFLAVGDIDGDKLVEFSEKYIPLINKVNTEIDALKGDQAADKARKRAKIITDIEGCNSKIVEINQLIAEGSLKVGQDDASKLDDIRFSMPREVSFFSRDLKRSIHLGPLQAIPYDKKAIEESSDNDDQMLDALSGNILSQTSTFVDLIERVKRQKKQEQSSHDALVEAVNPPLDELHQLLVKLDGRHEKTARSIAQRLKKSGFVLLNDMEWRWDANVDVARMATPEIRQGLLDMIESAKEQVSNKLREDQESDQAMEQLTACIAECNTAIRAANHYLKRGQVRSDLFNRLTVLCASNPLFVKNKSSQWSLAEITCKVPHRSIREDSYNKKQLLACGDHVADLAELFQAETRDILACIGNGVKLVKNIKKHHAYLSEPRNCDVLMWTGRTSDLDIQKAFKTYSTMAASVIIASEDSRYQDAAEKSDLDRIQKAFNTYSKMAASVITASEASRFKDAAEKSDALLTELVAIIDHRIQRHDQERESQKKSSMLCRLSVIIESKINLELKSLHKPELDPDLYSDYCQELRTAVLCQNQGIDAVVPGDLSDKDEAYIDRCYSLCEALSKKIQTEINLKEAVRAQNHVHLVESLRLSIGGCNVSIKSVNLCLRDSGFAMSGDLISDVDRLRHAVEKPTTIFHRFKTSDFSALQDIQFSDKEYATDQVQDLLTLTKKIVDALVRVIQAGEKRVAARGQKERENQQKFIEEVSPLLQQLNAVLAELHQTDSAAANAIFHDLRPRNISPTQQYPVEIMIDSYASKTIDQEQREAVAAEINAAITKAKGILAGATAYDLALNALGSAVAACNAEITDANSRLSRGKVHSERSDQLEAALKVVGGKSYRKGGNTQWSLGKFNFEATRYRSLVESSEAIESHQRAVDEIKVAISDETKRLDIIIGQKESLSQHCQRYADDMRQWRSDGLVDRSEQKEMFSAIVEAFKQYEVRLQQVVTVKDADYFGRAIAETSAYKDQIELIMAERDTQREQEGVTQEREACRTALETMINEQVNPALAKLSVRGDSSGVVELCQSFRTMVTCENAGIAPISVDQYHDKAVAEYDAAIEQARQLLALIQETQSDIDAQARQAINDQIGLLIERCGACDDRINTINSMLRSNTKMGSQLMTSLDELRDKVKKASWLGLVSSKASQLQIIDASSAYCHQAYSDQQQVADLITEAASMNDSLSGQIEAIKDTQAAEAEATELERVRLAEEQAEKAAAEQEEREKHAQERQDYFDRLSGSIGGFNDQLIEVCNKIGEDTHVVDEFVGLLRPLRQHFDCQATGLSPLTAPSIGHAVYDLSSSEGSDQQLKTINAIKERYTAIREDRRNATTSAVKQFKASLKGFEKRWSIAPEKQSIEHAGVKKINVDYLAYMQLCKDQGTPSLLVLSDMAKKADTFASNFDDIIKNTDQVVVCRDRIKALQTDFSKLEVEADTQQMAQVKRLETEFNESNKCLADIVSHARALEACCQSLQAQYQHALENRNQFRETCRTLRRTIQNERLELSDESDALKQETESLLREDFEALSAADLGRHKARLEAQHQALGKVLATQQQAQEAAEKIEAVQKEIGCLQQSSQQLLAQLQAMDPASVTGFERELESILQSCPADNPALSDLDALRGRAEIFKLKLQKVTKTQGRLLSELQTKATNKTTEIEAKLRQLSGDSSEINAEYVRDIHAPVLDNTLSSAQQRFDQLNVFGAKVTSAVAEQQRVETEKAALAAAEQKAAALAEAQEKRKARSDLKDQVGCLNDLAKALNNYFDVVPATAFTPLAAELIGHYDEFSKRLVPPKKGGFFSRVSLFSSAQPASHGTRLNALHYDECAFIDDGTEGIRSITDRSKAIIDSLEEKTRDVKADCRRQIKALSNALSSYALTESESESLHRCTIKCQSCKKTAALECYADLLNDFMTLSRQVTTRSANEARAAAAAETMSLEASRLREKFKGLAKEALAQHGKCSVKRPAIDALVGDFKALVKGRHPVHEYDQLCGKLESVITSAILPEGAAARDFTAFSGASSSSAVSEMPARAPEMMSESARDFLRMVEGISCQLDRLYDKTLSRKVTHAECQYFERFRGVWLAINSASGDAVLTHVQIIKYNIKVMEALRVSEPRGEPGQYNVGASLAIVRSDAQQPLRRGMLDKIKLIEGEYCAEYSRIALDLKDDKGRAAALHRHSCVTPIAFINT